MVKLNINLYITKSLTSSPLGLRTTMAWVRSHLPWELVWRSRDASCARSDGISTLPFAAGSVRCLGGAVRGGFASWTGRGSTAEWGVKGLLARWISRCRIGG